MAWKFPVFAAVATPFQQAMRSDVAVCSYLNDDAVTYIPPTGVKKKNPSSPLLPSMSRTELHQLGNELY